MALLSNSLRRLLEKTVVEAREVAEAGAHAALERLAVDRPAPFDEMTAADRDLRVKLRAHARQLGDARKPSGEQEIARLVAECAYAQWHRMLFARFLAENRLLIHPQLGVPVTLAECEELAAEAGEKDGWALAGRFAARMLPAIFRPDDPVLAVRLAPEHQRKLEALLGGLPVEVFTADDSLGWVYQFWQAKRKDEVNEAAKAGRKIGADELPAVTQLFTEPYMVRFLLHNTLGAWWAGKVLAERPELAQRATSEEELRHACALPGYKWSYLRFVRNDEGIPWRPAAGTFEQWPKRAAEITVLDPCCGSGHFLVEAFRILVPMRMAEEGLSPREACEAVLRDNLFGLEIDERCTQIAAFNLALTAWTYPDAGGYRPLPELHIACSGLTVGGKEEEWVKLAGKDGRLQEGMRRLYRLFKDAPTLGSLIDPRQGDTDLFTAGFEELQPLLEEALAREEVKRDAQATEAGIAAQGMAKAADFLARSYTLVATNVPYLQRSKHHEKLKDFCDKHYPTSKADLATVFLERCLGWCRATGTTAIVATQNWLFLATYRKLREWLVRGYRLHFVAQLGEGAFDSSQAAGAFPCLTAISAGMPCSHGRFAGFEVLEPRIPHEKDRLLRELKPNMQAQLAQLKNPDHKILLTGVIEGPLLERYAEGLQGIATADYERFGRCFWEMPRLLPGWVFQQSTVRETTPFGGREHVLLWEEGRGALASFPPAYVRGQAAWGKPGVAVSQMRHLPVTRYTGEAWDNNTAVILPRDPRHLPAIWSFCSSPEFAAAVRQLDKKLNVTNATLAKVPFDLAHWQKVAAEKYPNGLPKPFSNDPTQWIYHGHPCGSVVWNEEKKWTAHGPLRTDGTVLQVAVARLLGYRWPAETDPEMELADEQREWVRRCEELLELADEDGIVCIPPVHGEQPAADRLQRLLAWAYGAAWGPATLSTLLEKVGFVGRTLEDWLRDSFFEQHCQLFHERPFIWHIWDGRRRDGFAALVNYHKLDRRLLERLTYTVLGDWIEQQRRSVQMGERGADDRLAAALELQRKLELILKGEPPYDIFVRWKPLHEQPIGWEPDLNDGVRVNIRPFVETGVLRKNPRIQWTKDRGMEPENLRPVDQFPWFWKDGRFTGERVNDVHLTNAEKQTARERFGRARKEATL